MFSNKSALLGLLLLLAPQLCWGLLSITNFAVEPENPVSGDRVVVSMRVCSGGAPAYSSYYVERVDDRIDLYIIEGLQFAVPWCDDGRFVLGRLPGNEYQLRIIDELDQVEFTTTLVVQKGPFAPDPEPIPTASTMMLLLLLVATGLVGMRELRRTTGTAL